MCQEHEKNRKEFLIHMYDQMFNDINRHILVIWQSIGTLIATFALLSLVEKQIVSIDIAVALIVIVGLWLLCHLLDAGYWYNRNLVIIANIERQFLNKSDLKDIHYYFGKHRKDNKMITHLRIQFYFGVGIVSLVVLFHFGVQVLPGLNQPWSNFQPLRTLPYIFLVTGISVIHWMWRKRKNNYKEFLDNSPGSDVDSSEIQYGDGHPAN